MTDTHATEEPADPVPPAPEAAPAPPRAPSEAAAAPAPEAESEDNRTAREKVLDHFADCDDPDQSVAQIIQGTGLSRNTCEQAIFRAVQSEQLQRVSQGVYRLAPPKPPSPPKPESPSRNGHTNDEWIARIVAWQANPASWNLEEDGPPPNDPNHRIPLDVVGRFKDRQKREREKASKQAAADAELRDQLIAACYGNFTLGPGLDDVAPIRAAMEVVPLDCILSAIRGKTDKKLYPKNEPATSWREARLLKEIAETYCRFLLIPGMVQTWGAAGTAPRKPAGASEASPAVQSPPEPKDAPAMPPAQPDAVPDGEISPTAEAPGGPSRENIIAAFSQNRTPPQPATPQPRPAQANLNTRSPRGALRDSERPSALATGLPSSVVELPAPDDDVPPF